MKLAAIKQKQEAEKAKFRDDVFDCINHLTDYKKLKKGIVNLHKIYVNTKEEDDNSEVLSKEAEQRKNNLIKEGRLKEGE